MIFDYYIDFKYLAEELSSAKKERRALTAGLFLRIIDICVLENGRLLVDENRSIVRPLEEFAAGVGTTRDGLSAATENLVVTEFLNKLPPRNSITTVNGCRIYVSGGMSSGPDAEKMSIREISDRSRLVAVADFLIDREHPIERYFNFNGGLGSGKYGEKTRACARDVLTYSFDRHALSQDSDPSVRAFRNSVAAFGCAEAVTYEFFDAYGFRLGNFPHFSESAVSNSIKNIWKWLDLLHSKRMKSCATVHVYAMVEEGHIGQLKSHSDRLSILRDIFSHQPLSTRGDVSVVLHLAPKDTNSVLYKAFHDRRICSTTHSFSIGGGLDVLQGTGGRCLFEIHYCGRRGRNVQEPRLQMIRDYFQDPSRQNEVFVGTFIIPGTNS